MDEKRTEERTETHACDSISRAAAIEHLKKRLYETEFNSTAEYHYYQEIADNRVDVWMNEVPSAQPERKTGRWEPVPATNGRGGHFCNRCYEYAPSWKTGEERLTNYCPNCGAYMEGEQNE